MAVVVETATDINESAHLPQCRSYVRAPGLNSASADGIQGHGRAVVIIVLGSTFTPALEANMTSALASVSNNLTHSYAFPGRGQVDSASILVALAVMLIGSMVLTVMYNSPRVWYLAFVEVCVCFLRLQPEGFCLSGTVSFIRVSNLASHTDSDEQRHGVHTRVPMILCLISRYPFPRHVMIKSLCCSTITHRRCEKN